LRLRTPSSVPSLSKKDAADMEYALNQTDVEALELALTRPDTGPDPFVSAVQKWFKPRLTPAAIALLIAYTDRGLADAYRSAIQLSGDDWALLGLSKDTIGDIERARDQLEQIKDENQGFLACRRSARLWRLYGRGQDRSTICAGADPGRGKRGGDRSA